MLLISTIVQFVNSVYCTIGSNGGLASPTAAVHMAEMDDHFPTPPETGSLMAPVLASDGARSLLALRRSAGKLTLSEPGPDPDQLDAIVTVAMRVPDHRRVEPWRFIVIAGEARQAFADGLTGLYRRLHPDAEPGEVHENAASLPLRAPVVVAVVSSPDPAHKTPVWEQELSAGAVCHNLLLASNASGWAGVWLTEWIAYDPGVASLLGLEAHERIAGFIYLGTATAHPPERPRARLAEKRSFWTGN